MIDKLINIIKGVKGMPILLAGRFAGTVSLAIYVLLSVPDKIYCVDSVELALIIILIYALFEAVNNKQR